MTELKCLTRVPGERKEHNVVLFALSTCGWCKKTKRLLDELKVEYDYVDMDCISMDEKKAVRVKLRGHNPRASFPTLVIDDGAEVIIGYEDARMREVLG